MARDLKAIVAIATIGAALALAPAASPGGAPMRIGYFSDSPLPEGSVPLTQLPPEPRQQLASPSPGTPGVRG